MLPNKSLEIKDRFIFDFDDTIAKLLIDWKGWHSGVAKIIREFDKDFQVNPENLKMHFLQNDLFRKYGKACRDQIAAFSEEYEMKYATGVAPNPDVINIIQNITRGDLFVWSSNSRKTVEKYLKELGILNRFTNIVTRDDVFYLKPDTEGFSKIKNSSPLSSYVFFGDSIFDEKAAETIGIDFVNVKD
jgi:HAD superfamily hydrolase (TIGR01549 family)